MWRTYKDLDSGNLGSTILASFSNITELLLQGLTEERSSLLDIVNSIITLNNVSEIMLKGISPLMEKLRNLIEETDIPPLKWRYRCYQLRAHAQRGPSLTTDAEVWINEGVNYFSTVPCPVQDGI
jgi:hypothetical protein